MPSRMLVYIWKESLTTALKWVALPCPSSYSASASTLVNSGRNADGQVIADVIRSDIAKIEMKWNFLTTAQYAQLAQLFEEKYGGSFINAVSFFDVIKGDYDGDITKAPTASTGNNPCRTFYPNDRKVAFAKITLDSSGKPIGYEGVSLNLIDTCKIYGE